MICFKLRWKRGYYLIITLEIWKHVAMGAAVQVKSPQHTHARHHLVIQTCINPHADASSLARPSTSSSVYRQSSLLTLRPQRANINKSNKSVAREYERAPFHHVRTHCEMWPCLLFCSAQALDNIFYLSRTGSTKGGGGTVSIHVRRIHGEALLGDEEHR